KPCVRSPWRSPRRTTPVKLPSRWLRDLTVRLAPLPRRGRSRSAARRAVRLEAEPLEVRCTPSRFTVVNTQDSGAGSLRVAILHANAAPGADRIAFAIPAADPGFVDANHDGGFDPGDYWSI